MKVSEIASYVRSKNAGPFWVTIDIFCDNSEAYKLICDSSSISAKTFSDMFQVPESYIKLFYLDDLNVVKISYPRSTPQGGPNEFDMHAGQQYLPVLDIVL